MSNRILSQSKVCSRCRKEKSLSEFSKNGLSNYCRECVSDYDKERRGKPENKEKDKQYNLEYRSRPNYQEEQRARRERIRSLPGVKEKEALENRNYKFIKNYGITIQEYERMYVEQNGKCLICGEHYEMKGKSKIYTLCVDHDHETGKVRGLVCHRCNLGLGNFRDNMSLMEKALAYLRGKK